MTIELSSLGRVRIAIETGTSAYAVDQSASPGNFIDMPVIEGSLQPSRKEEKLDPQTLQTMLDDYEEKVRGPKSCEFNFSTILASTGTALTGAVTPLTTSNTAMLRFLETVMGGLLTPASPGAVLVSGATGTSTATQIFVTAGAGTAGAFTTGGPMGVIINGRMEVREVLSRTADSVSPTVAFSGVPANGSQVYSGYALYLTENPVNSLQMMHDGMEDSDKFVYQGLQGGFDLDVSTGQFPKLSAKLMGSTWTKLSSAVIAAGTIANYSPAIITDCEFIVGVVGSTTRNLVHCTDEKWTPGINYIDVKSSTAATTVLRKHRNRGRAITGQFTTYRDASSYDFETADSSRLDLSFYKQLGSTPGSTVMLCAPTVQAVTTNLADAGGLAGVQVDWEARNSTVFSTPTAGTYRSSAFKIFLI